MTVIILDIIWIWNDYLLPSLVLNGKDLRTIPLSTSSFFNIIQRLLYLKGIEHKKPVLFQYLSKREQTFTTHGIKTLNQSYSVLHDEADDGHAEPADQAQHYGPDAVAD